MEQIIIVGNLGMDPELKYTAQGDAVTNFSVAVNYRAKGDEKVKWFRISVWGKQAESCNQYLTKGSQVLIQGRMNVDLETGGPRIWYNHDGQPRASLEISANWVEFLSGNSGQGQGANSSPSKGDPLEIVDETDHIGEEEIPF